MKIIAESANDAWMRTMHSLENSNESKEQSPRGLKSKEMLNVSLEIKNPKKRVISNPIRKISLPFAFGELLWYLNGKNDLETMEYYSRMMGKFSDDGKTLNSAYGYRMFGDHPQIGFNQWKEVVERLREDRDSRQAIIHLHTPNNKPTKDEVCTLSLQFLIREDRLDMVVNMRSNDIVWGFTYDVFNFTTFQELMANELQVEVGTYYHNAASMHIYEKDYYLLESLNYFGYTNLDTFEEFTEEFDYEGLTIQDFYKKDPQNDWLRLNEFEQEVRFLVTGVNRRSFIHDELGQMLKTLRQQDPTDKYGHFPVNKALRIMAETFIMYGFYKADKNSTQNWNPSGLMDYDNIYHNMHLLYFNKPDVFRDKDEERLTILEGVDGVGKSTATSMLSKVETNVLHFDKPDREKFNPLVYAQASLMTGTTILDRSFISEIVYSQVYGRQSLIPHHVQSNLFALIKKRNAKVVLLECDPQVSYNRMTSNDKEKYTIEDIEKIKGTYESVFEAFRFYNFIHVDSHDIKLEEIK